MCDSHRVCANALYYMYDLWGGCVADRVLQHAFPLVFVLSLFVFFVMGWEAECSARDTQAPLLHGHVGHTCVVCHYLEHKKKIKLGLSFLL